MKRCPYVSLFAIILLIALMAGCWKTDVIPDTPDTATEPLRVHFIDVGQGDSIFIELPSGECILIDASEKRYGVVVSDYIDELGYDSIDYIVATHPHSDHIGGMTEVVNTYSVNTAWLPEVQNDTATYKNFRQALDDTNVEVKTATAGVSFTVGEVYLDFVAPVGDKHKDLNNWSAVLHLRYGDTSFLFTGDAEAASEAQIDADIYSDVLKVGHHGSTSSTSDDFLSSVNPEYAVISCGTGNSYGHPHAETLEKLVNAGIEVLRTDELGSIIIESDGSDVSIVDSLPKD